MSKSYRDKERLKSKKNHIELIEAHNNGSPDSSLKQEVYVSEKKIKRYGNQRKAKALEKISERKKSRRKLNNFPVE